MIELFPEHTHDNSLHTAILVGLVVTWGLFELYGWVFAGFVVAGYLAALGMVAPASLAVVLVESVLTYGLVWGVATGLSRLGVWSAVFGRERFLLFVLLALPVRLVVTGLAMPALTERLLLAGTPVDALGHGLLGVGVVLVPLTANTFWKLGLTRGLVQIGVSAGITWVFLAQVLARLTNFAFGEFERTFDALAVSAWESSRVVLLLVCTVFLGARNNLRYGWDFGGILVPALLAMLVFTPLRLVTTVVEIVVLAWVYERLLRLPVVRDLDLEGPRRIVSIFAVAYAWKWAVAAGAHALELPTRASDLHGFGYLLTSLVVARARKAGSVGRTLVPILFTAAQGVLVALPLSLLLGALGGRPAPAERPAEPDATVARVVASAAVAVPREAASSESGVSCVGCGDEGPLLLVARPHGDPDTAWLAGWLASRAELGGVLLPPADPSDHPTRHAWAATAARRAVASAREVAGARPLLVLVGSDGAPRLYPRRLDAGLPLATALAVPGLLVSPTAPPEAASTWWALLGPDDAILALPSSVAGDDAVATLPWGRLTEPPDVRPEAPELVARLVLPALRRAARAPGGLRVSGAAHLAALVGARWTWAEAPDGSRHGVLARAADGGAGTDLWIVRDGGGGPTVLATDAWRWPGLVAAGASAHLALGAGLTWVASHPPGSPTRWTTPSSPRSWLDLSARAALAPLDDAHEGALVLLEVPPPGQVVPLFGDGDGGDRLPPLPGLSAWTAAWPDARPTSTQAGATAWLPSLAYAVSYAEAVHPDRIVLGWLPAARVRELGTAPEREALRAWLRAAGIPVLDRAPAPPLTGAPVDGPVRAALAALAEVPSDTTLAGLRRLTGARLAVELSDLRVTWTLAGDGLRCRAVAAEDGSGTVCEAAP